MRILGKMGFQQDYGEVSTNTRPRDGDWYKRAEANHALHRVHWERQVAAKKKRQRLEMMLEMKRLKEL